MLCPACRDPLVILEVEDIELDACPHRHGLWFDAQEIHQLFTLAAVPEELRELETRLEALDDQRGRRRCPRCRSVMEAVKAPRDPTIILDRCKRGHGLWFDDGELVALLRCLLGEEDEPLLRIREFLGDFARPATESGDVT
jgi:Zn-finger nucleic acid-binding protein